VPVRVADADPLDAPARLVGEEPGPLGLVVDGDAQPLRDLELLIAESEAGALGHDHRVEAGAVPPLQRALDPGHLPLDAELREPLHRRVRLGHQQVGELRVGHALGDAHQVVVEVVLGVGRDVEILDLGRREVGHQAGDVLEAVVREAHGARGEARIPAPQLDRRLLQHDDVRALLSGGVGGGHRGVARADDDDVVVPLIRHVKPPST
jgi:hypothetical protein